MKSVEATSVLMVVPVRMTHAGVLKGLEELSASMVSNESGTSSQRCNSQHFQLMVLYICFCRVC